MITVGVVCVKVRGLWSVQSTHRGLFVWSIGSGGVVESPFGYRTQAIVRVEEERFCRAILYEASKLGRGGLFGGEMPVMLVRVVK